MPCHYHHSNLAWQDKMLYRNQSIREQLRPSICLWREICRGIKGRNHIYQDASHVTFMDSISCCTVNRLMNGLGTLANISDRFQTWYWTKLNLWLWWWWWWWILTRIHRSPIDMLVHRLMSRVLGSNKFQQVSFQWLLFTTYSKLELKPTAGQGHKTKLILNQLMALSDWT